ncbi:MAG: arsenate reductase ArsC [Moraxellaceae bacterium]|nr:arsenate reductase ArsC [Moraxellaceae bacterium]MDZ4385711.1 arsenate reductase ArsC [Moraxellaceae bacterium]
MTTPKKILVLCTGNSCRSQMAEAILNHDLAGQVVALSAGTVPQPVVAEGALTALQLAGLQTSELFPKTVDSVLSADIDLIITVCDHANEHCPTLPETTEHIHAPFHDPHGEQLDSFIQVRDEIREQLVNLVRLHFRL